MIPVKYTPLFLRAFKDITECGRDVYDQKTQAKLLSALRDCKTKLQDNPLLGARELLLEGQELVYRHIVIPPYFKLIYTIYEDTIYFSDIWDTRRDPKKLEDRLP